jgi:hypothetical protein
LTITPTQSQIDALIESAASELHQEMGFWGTSFIVMNDRGVSVVPYLRTFEIVLLKSMEEKNGSKNCHAQRGSRAAGGERTDG